MANKFTVNTYSPSDVRLVIGGYQLTAWDSITIARRVDNFLPVFGIRGKHCTVPMNDTSSFITIPLLQTSPSNDVMSYIHQLDIENGTGRIALILKDDSGKSVFSSNEGRILGYPEVKFSGGFEYRVWRIFLQTTDSYTVGGNTRPSTSIFDSAFNVASSFVSNIL